MTGIIDDQDLKALEACLEVANPGPDADPEDQATYRQALGVITVLRLMLPEGSTRHKLEVSVVIRLDLNDKPNG